MGEQGGKGTADGEGTTIQSGGACAGGSGTLFVVQLPPRLSVNYELSGRKG